MPISHPSPHRLVSLRRYGVMDCQPCSIAAPLLLIDRSIKEECLSKLILFGERSLRHALGMYVKHFHAERNHQGRDNVILFPSADDRIGEADGNVEMRERLGGLLKFYHRKAA